MAISIQAPPSGELPERLAWFRKTNAEWIDDRRKHYKLDPKLERDLKPGWLLPYLMEADLLTWRRWLYWVDLMELGRLNDQPIPKIHWMTDSSSRSMFDQQGHRHIQQCLDLIPNCGGGSWQGWSSWDYVNYFFDWLLYGFAHPGYQLPKEPVAGASMRLYQTFNLNLLIAFPHDYFGDILALNRFGKGQGFYPTPMPVVTCMVEMLMHDVITCDLRDSRLETVNEPCLGTGRMLLAASNYSLRLSGQDINGTVIKAALINGYMYAPWLVKPLPFLSGELTEGDRPCQDDEGNPATVSKVISDRMAAGVEAMENTEHDTENQWEFEPIKKRRKKGDPEAFQGKLF